MSRRDYATELCVLIIISEMDIVSRNQRMLKNIKIQANMLANIAAIIKKVMR